jgi:rhodanese-related sulfurtransferase
MMKKYGVAEFQEKMNEGYAVLDLRSAEEFENGFIPGSLFIDPKDENFEVFLREIVFPVKKWLAVLPDQAKDLPNLENIEGVLEYGMDAWTRAGKEIGMIISIKADEFILDLKHDKEIHLMDFRKRKNFDASHIESASNYLPEYLPILAAELQANEKYYILSDQFSTSLSIASYLNRCGITLTRTLKGSYEDISDSDLNIVNRKKKRTQKN